MTWDLVAVDMDGTFLNAHSTYDRQRFAELYQRMRGRGIAFAVASGNQYWQLRSYFQGFPEVLFIAENGGVIGSADEIWKVTPMAAQETTQALKVLDATPDLFTLACGAQSAYALAGCDPELLRLVRHYYPRLAVVTDWSEVPEPVVKLALMCAPEQTATVLERLAANLPSGVVPVSSGHGSIDLIARGVNKGSGLRWLGDRVGIQPQRMVAYGDAGNDLEMLATVGWGLAMANASEAVKDAADAVIGHHDESGVLNHLEAWLGDQTTG